MTERASPVAEDAEQSTQSLEREEADQISMESSPQASSSLSDRRQHGPRDLASGKKTGSRDDSSFAEEEAAESDDEEEDEDIEEDEDDGSVDEEEEDEEEEEEEEEEEPHLKYERLTSNLGSVYKNGDATSSFIVAGDKMIIGTHNGNIHVIQLPIFQTQRVYHAHAASVTSISVSPYPPPLSTETSHRQAIQDDPVQSPARQYGSPPSSKPRQAKSSVQIPRLPSNDIHIATSSMDGNVCIQSLVDLKDVQLRNFARPVQAVALSPDYKNDRTYVSGGQAGQLIMTVGGGTGRSTSTTIGGAAATASGWLGSMGLSSNTGKDTILHSGEGTISCIKWSLTGKYVVWLNEHGIKIMRSHLHLDAAESEQAWKRIGHIDRPSTEEWNTMAGVWKGRAEWIDERAMSLKSDDSTSTPPATVTPATQKLQEQAATASQKVEKLLVGWGGSLWIIHVHPGEAGRALHEGKRALGHAQINKILRMDCIISGISLYTPSILIILAYCPNEDEEHAELDPTQRGHQSKGSNASTSSGPTGGIRRRQNNQPPELRLIDLDCQEEIDKMGLSVSRYERLSSNDYHLGVLPARNAASAAATSRGALEALAGLGTDVWNAAINPKSLFSSGASVRSLDSADDAASSQKRGTPSRPIRSHPAGPPAVHPHLVKPGAKIFIHSPYDCILATKREQSDHLAWLVEHQQYQKAWGLLDAHPDLLEEDTSRLSYSEIRPETPTRGRVALRDVDETESVADSAYRLISTTEKEQRRVGELWIQELVNQGSWVRAGEVCGKVVKSSDRWSKWIWTFVEAKKFDEIVNFIPSELMQPPIPTTVYEVVLGHFLDHDKAKFRDLLERWPTELFDIDPITTALENQLKYRDVRPEGDENVENSDWHIVIESLARLHEANGRYREALKCFIKIHDADSAFKIIRDNHLADAVADDIPSFIGLRVPASQLKKMSRRDLEAATAEAISLLVDEAQHGLVRPSVVVEQLLSKRLMLYLYYYFKGLWLGEGINERSVENMDRLIIESQSLVDEFADLAVQLFAKFDRSLLMEFLKSSTSYAFEKAVAECESYKYYDELVYLYSKTGQMKRALYLIIDRLKNVQKAIEFAKEQDDPDLWEDLLDYSMDKPSFIRGLLEQVGTAIDPITLVKRIPEGLEIQGLREGLTHMMKEHEIQYSISSGVARVLRSEVGAAQKELRAGQHKGVKFEVNVNSKEHIDIAARDTDTRETSESKNKPTAADHAAATQHDHRTPQPGHCARCHEPFTEFEMETLLGYVCGHVFHVSHLLEMLHGGGGQEDVDVGREGEGSRYSVGLKVMRARLLKDRVRGGCPICHVR